MKSKKLNIRDTVNKIIKQRTKVIDNFCKMFIVCNADLIKKYPTILSKMILVEKRLINGGSEFSIRFN